MLDAIIKIMNFPNLPFDKYYKFITVIGVVLISLSMYLLYQVYISSLYEFAELNKVKEEFEMSTKKMEDIISETELVFSTYIEATKSGKKIDEKSIEKFEKQESELNTERDKFYESAVNMSYSIDKNDALKNKLNTTKELTTTLLISGFTMFIFGSFQWWKSENKKGVQKKSTNRHKINPKQK